MIKRAMAPTATLREEQRKKLEHAIRTIPNWPKEGIMFRDVTTLLLDVEGTRIAIDALKVQYEKQDFTTIAAIESRGFIFGAMLATAMEKKLLLVRKKGKLPHDTITQSYEKEYGKDYLEIHKDAVKKGEKVLIIDDLIATGGSAIATARLIERLGGRVVGMGFVIGLPDLINEEAKRYPLFTVIDFPGH